MEHIWEWCILFSNIMGWFVCSEFPRLFETFFQIPFESIFKRAFGWPLPQIWWDGEWTACEVWKNRKPPVRSGSGKSWSWKMWEKSRKGLLEPLNHDYGRKGNHMCFFKVIYVFTSTLQSHKKTQQVAYNGTIFTPTPIHLRHPGRRVQVETIDYTLFFGEEIWNENQSSADVIWTVWYCWWFRNSKQPPGMYWTIKTLYINIGINYINWCRISEPSTLHILPKSCHLFFGWWSGELWCYIFIYIDINGSWSAAFSCRSLIRELGTIPQSSSHILGYFGIG